MALDFRDCQRQQVRPTQIGFADGLSGGVADCSIRLPSSPNRAKSPGFLRHLGEILRP